MIKIDKSPAKSFLKKPGSKTDGAKNEDGRNLCPQQNACQHLSFLFRQTLSALPPTKEFRPKNIHGICKKQKLTISQIADKE